MQPPVKVFAKVAALLDLLAEERDLTPAELAERLDEPRSTVYRLLAALEEQDFVQPGARRGSFELGMKLFSLGSTVLRRFDDERAAALPAMERLHESTRQTVFLVVRRGLEAVCLERIDGQLVQVLILPVGGTLPLHGGAAPRVLLAHEPRELWEEFVASGTLERYTDRTATSRRALFAQLETILEQGYAVSDEDVIPGIASIAAPIFDHRDRVRATVSLSGPRPSVLDGNFEDVRDRLRAAARDISKRLGQQ
jgi:DNA-binding IclR family transcriptional regulator